MSKERTKPAAGGADSARVFAEVAKDLAFPDGLAESSPSEQCSESERENQDEQMVGRD